VAELRGGREECAAHEDLAGGEGAVRGAVAAALPPDGHGVGVNQAAPRLHQLHPRVHQHVAPGPPHKHTTGENMSKTNRRSNPPKKQHLIPVIFLGAQWAARALYTPLRRRISLSLLSRRRDLGEEITH